MNNRDGDFSNYSWKVNHPNSNNSIPAMRSNGFQAPFYLGGSQIPYYLGVKGNTNTQPEPVGGHCYSTTEKIVKEFKKK